MLLLEGRPRRLAAVDWSSVGPGDEVLSGWVGFTAPFIDKLDGYFSTAIYEF